MSHVLIIHQVDDYANWKRVFDDAADIRRDAGERSYQVLRRDDDANTVVHLSIWTSHGAARAFFGSPRLVAIREQAGVRAPEFLYLDELESGPL